MDGVENQTSNSVIGNGGGDVATNGKPFWLTVDFKEVKILRVYRLLIGEVVFVLLKLKSLLLKMELPGSLWDRSVHRVQIKVLHSSILWLLVI